MRKLVRTVIINDEDEDEDEDEVNMHHRHHHVSIALGAGARRRGAGGAGSGPRRGGRQLSTTQGRAAGEKALGACLETTPRGKPTDCGIGRGSLLPERDLAGSHLQPQATSTCCERAGGAVREAALVPRAAWRWRTGWWEADGRRFSTAAAPPAPLREAAGTNPEVTLSFVSARRSPRGAEICTRSGSGQRAGSVPGAELPPLLPVSKRTSPAAAREPPPACPNEERPRTERLSPPCCASTLWKSWTLPAGLRDSSRMGLLPLSPLPWSSPDPKSRAGQMLVTPAGSSQAPAGRGCPLVGEPEPLRERSSPWQGVSPTLPGSEEEDALRGAGEKHTEDVLCAESQEGSGDSPLCSLRAPVIGDYRYNHCSNSLLFLSHVAERMGGARTILEDSLEEPSWVTAVLPRSSGQGARGRRCSGGCSRLFCLFPRSI